MNLPRPSLARASRSLSAKLAALCLAVAQIGTAHAACAGATLPGTNLSGGEFSPSLLPGRYGWNYIYPGQAEIDFAKSKHFKLIRVPFLWERVQPVASSPLVDGEMQQIDAVVALAAKNGLTVALDVHNYGQYQGKALDDATSPVGALPDLWRRLATRYKGSSHVVFGMMNEPHDIASDRWAATVRLTLDAIRATGAKNTVLIPGTFWSGVQSWFTPYPALSNATTLLPIVRSDTRTVLEVHGYYDQWSSGTVATCEGAAKAVAGLTSIASWARTNHVKLFLGEFGVSQRPECVKALDDSLAVMERDSDVWYGWTYWAAGAWWGTYMFNIQLPGGTSPQGTKLQASATRLTTGTCTKTLRQT